MKKNIMTPRENFLMNLLNKIIKEYKNLLDKTRQIKPLKILEILEASSIPGETRFSIQITNKNCQLQLSAAEIIHNGYNLNDFSQYHAEIISQAAQGKLIEFLQRSNKQEIAYKISSKKFDRKSQQYIFTIETLDQTFFDRSAAELSVEKEILTKMSLQDVYDIAYTQGSESIVNEKAALLLAKQNKEITP